MGPRLTMQTRFDLTQDDLPTHWINLLPDFPEPLPPPLHPGTREPLPPEALHAIFPESLVQQEMCPDRTVAIPDEVLMKPGPLDEQQLNIMRRHPRIGHELLYDQLARTNVELLRSIAPRRIVTACPHCRNALGTEYRPFGADFDVVHHTTLLAELVADGRLAPVASVDAGVTYHDPCYLGRYAGEFEAPRRLIEASASALTEMPRSRSTSFCCGGGGGQAWMPGAGSTKQRINVMRVREAIATGARTLAVACPFCIRMLDDGVKASGGEAQIAVRDVAELLLDATAPQR